VTADLTTASWGSGDTAALAGPAWLREFASTLSVHSQFVFHGNVHDQFVTESCSRYAAGVDSAGITCSPTSGSVTVKVEPRVRRETTVSAPPCACAIH